MAPTRLDIERFERFISPEPNSGCWLWVGAASPSGYGNFGFGRSPSGRVSTISAHRFAFLAWRGGIPAGQMVLHKCDVRCCVNPDHLFLGTQADNINDMMAKGRNRFVGRPLANFMKTHCQHGHPLSGDNIWLRRDGARICKACRARIARDWRKKK